MRDDVMLELSAVDQAKAIARGDLDSEELVDLYLRRIERLDGALSSFAHVDRAGARRQAKHCDRERDLARKSGARLPPFHGVPTALKDLNLVAQMPAKLGSRAFERFVPPNDDRTARRLRHGGFVLLGKTTTSELGTMPMTETDIAPPTRNPWNLGHTSGGSSGGASSAVAARLIPIAQGSDGAGSIRIPSSFCGLFGIKASRGRVAHPLGADDRHILYTMGPMARSVADAAAMLDVMAGLSVGRPHWAPRPPRLFAESVDDERLAVIPRRARIITKNPLGLVDPEVEAATLRVARFLAELGAHVEEAELPPAELDEFLPVWQLQTSQIPVPNWSLTQPTTAWLGERGRHLDAADVLRLQVTLAERVRSFCVGAELWIMPTVPVTAPRVGALAGLDPEATFRAAAPLGSFTALFNLSGQPAVSIPMGFSRDGLPIGVQLVGRMYEEATLLAIARLIEKAMPWPLAAPDAIALKHAA